jgi:hypothetical protein
MKITATCLDYQGHKYTKTFTGSNWRSVERQLNNWMMDDEDEKLLRVSW